VSGTKVLVRIDGAGCSGDGQDRAGLGTSQVGGDAVGESGQEAGEELARQCPQFLDGLDAPPGGVLSGAGEDRNRLANSLSAGSLRWAWASVRRMLAKVIASAWSDFFRETQCRSR
jgi:hypothetical protein